jgi:hypothetical protein
MESKSSEVNKVSQPQLFWNAKKPEACSEVKKIQDNMHMLEEIL